MTEVPQKPPGPQTATEATEGSRDAPAREPNSRGVLAAIWLSVAIFLAVLALLATRVASGHDPALSAREAAAPLPPRRVLIRRIYEHKVIVHLPARVPAPPANASQQVSSAGGLEPSLPVTRTS
ncbi:MAG TPA: hypothetical protein VID70_02330 [Solirubrobacteraceae bacterium]